MDDETELVLSSVTAWEIAIKFARRRLDLPEPPTTYVPNRVRQAGLDTLAVTIEHAIVAGALQPIHNDPFDRLLIAQSQVEKLPILTSDTYIARYDVEVIW